jgi:hypothetical protein
MGNATEAQKFHLVRPQEASAPIKLWGRTAFSSLDEATRDAAMALYKKVPGFNGPAKRVTSSFDLRQRLRAGEKEEKS